MEIYVKKNEEQLGPFSVTAVKQAVESGTFEPDDLAWYAGQKSWDPIHKLIDISPIPKATPPQETEKNPIGQPESPTKANTSLFDKLNSGIGGTFGMEDGGDLGVSKFFNLFKSLDFEFLLPFGIFFNLLFLRKKAVRWVLFFGLVPLMTYILADKFGLSFRETIWIFEIYFCIFWALYFHGLIQPQAGIWKRAIGYAFFTVIIGIPLDLAFGSFPVIRNLLSGVDSSSAMYRLFGCILGVGLIEETVKALPLIIFGLFKGTQRNSRNGLFLGFMSGLGFAATEGVMYSFGAASAASNASAGLADAAFTGQILQIMFRFMSGTLLHGAWSGIMGWFIGAATGDKTHRWQIICVGLGVVSFLHGMSDFFAGGITHLFLAAASILLFMTYLVHEDGAAVPPVPDMSDANTSVVLPHVVEMQKSE